MGSILGRIGDESHGQGIQYKSDFSIPGMLSLCSVSHPSIPSRSSAFDQLCMQTHPFSMTQKTTIERFRLPGRAPTASGRRDSDPYLVSSIRPYLVPFIRDWDSQQKEIGPN